MAVKSIINKYGGISKPTAINSAENYILKNLDDFTALYGTRIYEEDGVTPDEEYLAWFSEGLRDEYILGGSYCGCC